MWISTARPVCLAGASHRYSGHPVWLTPLPSVAPALCLCVAHAYMMLLRGFMGELGPAVMSVTEMGAVLGSAAVDHQPCLLMTAAGSLHDALKLIRHTEHQIHIHTTNMSKVYVNTRSRACETSRRRWQEKISAVDPEKKPSKNVQYFDRAYLGHHLLCCPQTLKSRFSSALHAMVSMGAHGSQELRRSSFHWICRNPASGKYV